MKKVLFALGVSFLMFSCYSQQVFEVVIEPFQEVELVSGAEGSAVSVPVRYGTAIMGGSFDQQGLGKYLVFNGSHLRIVSLNMGSDGYRHVRLRREDGRNFFDKFPVIQAKLIPVVENQRGFESPSK